VIQLTTAPDPAYVHLLTFVADRFPYFHPGGINALPPIGAHSPIFGIFVQGSGKIPQAAQICGIKFAHGLSGNCYEIEMVSIFFYKFS